MTTDFAVGQRWLSDTETELGLGVIVDLDERSVSILFPETEETRVYAKATAPLSRVVLKVGDTLTTAESETFKVTGVTEVMGVLRYEVEGAKPIMETRLAANISLARPLERLLAAQIDNLEWYRLRTEGRKLHADLNQTGLTGLIGPRVGLNPHQMFIAHEVGSRLKPRVLLADEVGLGKTIEAGLIMHRQIQNGLADRILILVPDSLQFQWLIEMKRKFHLDFSVFDLVRTAAIKEHDPEANPFLTQQRILCSLDLLLDHADLMTQALNAGFDMLCVDEAHHLHWSEDQGSNPAYDMVELFAMRVPSVLLLSATPEQMGLESHFARLRLLDPERFASFDSFFEETQRYAEVAKLADQILADSLDSESKELVTQLLGEEALEASTQKLLSKLIDRHGTGRVLFRNTRDSVPGFKGRQAHLYPLQAPEEYAELIEDGAKVSAQLWPELFYEDWAEFDPRVEWLLGLLEGELKFDKVLLIARSGDTVASLEQALSARGVRTALFVEDMSLLERDQASVYFADESGAQILLASEVGSEGRNFQFASHLVLFDLPTNPDVLEQRIGRLDRIGQKQDVVLHVPVFEASASQRLARWYQEALGVFDAISPTAQRVQEQFVEQLKPVLMSSKAPLDSLIQAAKVVRMAQEAELKSGRDRLLELSSCRPGVASRICNALLDVDDSGRFEVFLTEFFAAVNLNALQQADQSYVLQPSDELLVEDLELPEDGMSLTFERDHALVRDDLEFMSLEHPFATSVFSMIKTSTFGNTSVALLKTASAPEGSMLFEAWFRPEVIAPKRLGLDKDIGTPAIRVLVSQNLKDLSERISFSALDDMVTRLGKTQARQVVKAKTQEISTMFEAAQSIAAESLEQLSANAAERFKTRSTAEISRLSELAKVNPSVRADEIQALKDAQAEGVRLLSNMALTPDSVRLLVCVRP